MRNKHIILLFFNTLLLHCLCLHTAHQQSTQYYNSSFYLQTLQQRFKQYKTDMLELKKQVQTLNQQLKQSADNEAAQIRIMQQGIAQERDLVFNIQSYMQLPFEYRACKDNTLTPTQKQQMKKNILSTKQSLKSLRAATASQSCNDCTLKQQIQLDISQQQIYLNLLEQALNHQCKKIAKQLEAQNVTGLVNIARSYFKDNLNAPNWQYGTITQDQYKLIVFSEAAKYNLTSCPLQRPFVDKQSNQCFNCPPNLNFSLGSRKCMPCPSNYTYNDDLMECVRDQIHCQPHQKLSQDGQCKPANLSSVCHPDEPIWNPNTKKCQSCPQDKPIFNSDTQSCQPCKINCSQTHPSSNDKTISLCPPLKPVWNPTQRSCQECPQTLPSFNKQSGKCQACQQSQVYSPHLKQCISQVCLQGFIFSFQQMKCISTVCPSNTPVFNSATQQCQQCPPNYPLYNLQTKQCTQCMYPQPYFNTVSKQCEQCPPSQPKYYHEIGRCTKCYNNQPYFNATTKQCEACPQGSYYDFTNENCRVMSGTNTENTPNESRCPLDKPIYNIEKKICTACPSYQIYNSDKGICEIKCQEGRFDTQKKECIKLCEDGEYYDEIRNQCVKTQTNH